MTHRVACSIVYQPVVRFVMRFPRQIPMRLSSIIGGIAVDRGESMVGLRGMKSGGMRDQRREDRGLHSGRARATARMGGAD